MIRISLNDQEKADLQKLRLNRKTNVGERAHYVLLSSDGLSPPEIAKHCSRNIHTIRLWLSNYISYGIDGLYSKLPPGRAPKKRTVVEEHIDELLSKDPSDYGYKEAGWQINILIDYFEGIGLSVGKTTIKDALDNKGYVFKRFSKSTPKNAPTAEEKQNKVTNMINSIQSSATDNSEIFFLDESHFSNQPYVNRGWFKVGKKNSKY